MLRALRQPRWLIAVLVVLVLAAVFTRLGLWQLDRLEERRAGNALAQERLETDPIPLDDLLAGDPIDLNALQYRTVVVDGEFDPTEEVLIRSQVELGQAGFHVITPLVTGETEAVLVNRGWVPLTMDAPPVAAEPPGGSVSIEGWVHLTQTRPPLGSEEPQGDLDVLNRVDIGRISEQVPYELASVYVVDVGERSDELPIPVAQPDFTDEGPHLAYAIQWFGFALVGVVGFYFLLRRKGGQSREGEEARSSTNS